MSEVSTSTEILNLNPSQDLFKKGFDNGSLFALYNFVNYELDSTPLETYFVSEISSDRTEIRLSNNFLSNEQISSSYAEFKERLDSPEFFDEFYIAFEGNNYNIGINCFLDTSKEKSTVLVKLYDALPTQYKVKDELYILTKTAETKLYKVNQSTSNPSTDALDPSTIFSDGFELDNQSIIPNEEITSTFTPEENNIEFYIYDINLNLVGFDLNFTDYTITGPGLVDSDAGTGVCSLGPQFTTQEACTAAGGTWTSTNGGTCSLGPKYQTETECTEAGGIWTSNIESANGACSLGPEYSTKQACEAAGGQWTPSSGVCSLGPQFTTQAACLAAGGMWSSNRPGVCTLGPQYTTQYACIAAGGIWHNSEIYGDATFLRGPNTNLEIKDFVNNSTVFKTKNDLVDSPSTSSRNNLDYYLNQRGVAISPDYSKFDEFVNFSSAKQRLQNFYYKVQQIEDYEDELNILGSITGSTSESISVTSNKSSIETNISNIIKNFDGYEYYLYYIEEPSSYPKTGSKFPYELKDSNSTDVLTWLGSDDENSPYYGGQILSASFYDSDNQNWLFYTVPEFIRENEENDNYLTFCNMVGQSFDEIWLYTKAVSQKSNTTNQLDKGVPLDLAQPTIEGLGYQGFGNNYNNQNNYIGLTGEDNGSFVPPTGSELITNYIAVNNGSIINYWEDNYAFTGYVEQIIEEGFPYAIDRVSKEIYKRLYHNMAYLVKKKGTTAGLRQLINIWGIPSTILRINEFGGKDKDNSDDYDLWYNRYSYAYTPVGTQLFPSASMVIPWMPLLRNKIADSATIVPDGLSFRFKTQGIPKDEFRGTYYTQSLLVKKSDEFASSTEVDFGITLTYEPQVTGSYPGAESNEYSKYGRLQFYISGSGPNSYFTGSNNGIYLPFFDEGWWTVSLSRNFHADVSVNSNSTLYTLRAANNIYNGDDGDRIGFRGSSSVNAIGSNLYGTGLYGVALYGGNFSYANSNWNRFSSKPQQGIYLGGLSSGSTLNGVVLNEPNRMFVGSFQEFRYYSYELKEEVFNDLVMNPESIEGNKISGEQSSFDIVNFRAPLGNELENVFYISSSLPNDVLSLTSLHPAISGEAPQVITQSFFDPTTGATSSKYDLFVKNKGQYNQTLSLINREPYLLDQPAIGITNRITNKIQVNDGTDFGKILSNQISIEQDYLISRSYTEDINSLEVGFAPADEVNDDIIATFGHGVIGDAIADPRFTQEKTEFYPRLVEIEKEYLKKYTKGNVQDYIRLIKYIDDSLFKAIKAYVPARTSVTTGIIIKQNMLDRSRAIPTTVDADTTIAFTPETGSVIQGTPQTGYNSPIIKRDLTLTSSIDIEGEAIDGLMFGGTAGVLERFNYYGPATINEKTGEPGKAEYGEIPITQSYIDSFDTIAGLQNVTESTQAEFYTGEFDGSEFPAVTQSLFNNPFISPKNTFSSFETTTRVYTPSYFEFKYEINILVNTTLAETELASSTPNGVVKLVFVGSTAGSSDPGKYSALYLYGMKFPTQDINGVDTRRFIEKFESSFITPLPLPSGEYPWEQASWMNKSIYEGNSNVPFFQFTIAPNPVDGLHNIFPDNFDSGSFKDNLYPQLSTSPVGTSVENLNSNTFISTTLRIELFNSSNRSIKFKGLSFKGPLLGWQGDKNHRGLIAGEDIFGVGADNSIVPDGTTTTPSRFYYQTLEDIKNQQSTIILNGLPDGESEALLIQNNWIYYDTSSVLFDSTTGNGDNNMYNIPAGYSGDTIHVSSHFSAIASQNPITGEYANLLATFTNPSFNLPRVPLSSDPNESYFTHDGSFTSDPIYKILNGEYEIVKSLNDTISFFGINEVKGIYDSYGVNGDDAQKYPSDLTEVNSLSFLSSYSPTIFSAPIAQHNNAMVDEFTSLPIFYPFEGVLTDINFDNSIYNAIINNVINNRTNKFKMDVDYSTNPTIPVNQIALINGTATRAQVPESNYTSKQVTIPRYDGSKLSSANYNFPTPAGRVGPNIGRVPSVLPKFLNGDTGFWNGDTSYGNTAVVDKNPIYFAHFKSSTENENLEGTYTFNIDSLIEAPFEDILGKDFFPKIIKIDGSNNNLQATSNTFEVDRKATVSYNNTIVNRVNYSNLPVGDNVIYQGGIEFDNIIWNISSSNDDNRFISFTGGTSQIPISFSGSYDTLYPGNFSNLLIERKNNLTSNPLFPAAPNTRYTGSGVSGTFTFDDYGNNGVPGDTNVSWLTTGSNCFLLGGPLVLTSASIGAVTSSGTNVFVGTALTVIHTYNKSIKDQIPYISINQAPFAGPNIPYLYTQSFGIPNNVLIDPNNSSNYIRYDVSQSIVANNSSDELLNYKDTQAPFLIEEGDEIKIQYNTPNELGVDVTNTQTFQVIGVPNNGFDEGVPNDTDSFLLDGEWKKIANDATTRKNLMYGFSPVDPLTTSTFTYRASTNCFDKIEVTPDPQSLNPPIISGSINNFQIIRRVNADDRVILFQTTPRGSEGVNTPSGPGFLIPNDLTSTQKLNVESLISLLNSKNTFKDELPSRDEGLTS